MQSTSGAAEAASSHHVVMARRIHLLVGAVVLGGAVVVVVLSELFRLGWGWTGFPENGHLWDWLHLLVLPLVLLLLPLWVATHAGHARAWRAGLAATGVAFAVLA